MKKLLFTALVVTGGVLPLAGGLVAAAQAKPAAVEAVHKVPAAAPAPTAAPVIDVKHTGLP